MTTESLIWFSGSIFVFRYFLCDALKSSGLSSCSHALAAWVCGWRSSSFRFTRPVTGFKHFDFSSSENLHFKPWNAAPYSSFFFDFMACLNLCHQNSQLSRVLPFIIVMTGLWSHILQLVVSKEKKHKSVGINVTASLWNCVDIATYVV